MPSADELARDEAAGKRDGALGLPDLDVVRRMRAVNRECPILTPHVDGIWAEASGRVAGRRSAFLGSITEDMAKVAPLNFAIAAATERVNRAEVALMAGTGKPDELDAAEQSLRSAQEQKAEPIARIDTRHQQFVADAEQVWQDAQVRADSYWAALSAARSRKDEGAALATIDKGRPQLPDSVTRDPLEGLR